MRRVRTRHWMSYFRIQVKNTIQCPLFSTEPWTTVTFSKEATVGLSGDLVKMSIIHVNLEAPPSDCMGKDIDGGNWTGDKGYEDAWY